MESDFISATRVGKFPILQENTSQGPLLNRVNEELSVKV